jgi:hypothetical protein
LRWFDTLWGRRAVDIKLLVRFGSRRIERKRSSFFLSPGKLIIKIFVADGLHWGSAEGGVLGDRAEFIPIEGRALEFKLDSSERGLIDVEFIEDDRGAVDKSHFYVPSANLKGTGFKKSAWGHVSTFKARNRKAYSKAASRSRSARPAESLTARDVTGGAAHFRMPEVCKAPLYCSIILNYDRIQGQQKDQVDRMPFIGIYGRRLQGGPAAAESEWMRIKTAV